MKTDSTASIMWEKSGGGSDGESINKIIPLANHQYFVGGSTRSEDYDVSFNHYASKYDYWMLILDQFGNIICEKTFGGTANDELKTVIKTTDGNFIMLGTSTSFDGDLTFNHGLTDVWAIKVDTLGNRLWENLLAAPDWMKLLI